MNNVSFFDGANRFVIDKPIRLIELFAGIGSQAKALERIIGGGQFEHYRICEFDKYAVASYNAVHGTNFATSDITKITADDLGIVDTDKYCYIMTYSFPCQDLSLAGKQRGMEKGAGTRSGLLWEVERLLDECKELPQVLVMENVPQVIGTKNIEHFAKWQEKLESLGYKNKWQVLNAKDFGVPQNRERCFMVSVLGDYYYEFPKKIKLEKRLKDLLESEVDEKYYLSDKNRVIFKYGSYYTWRDNKGSINTQCNRASGVDSYSLTIATANTPQVLENHRIRKLTPKECWRLMGFDDADVDRAKAIGMSDAQLYKQAGNSIVVNVLEAIMEKLIKNT